MCRVDALGEDTNTDLGVEHRLKVSRRTHNRSSIADPDPHRSQIQKPRLKKQCRGSWTLTIEA
jgi:hypothetical protein